MNIVITQNAKNSLKQLYNYYKQEVSKQTADKISTEIIQHINLLKSQPNLGQVEENLIALNLEHRYLLKRHYKIIYRATKETIYITDIFDTRQHPTKMKG